jgi:hypothetical protein
VKPDGQGKSNKVLNSRGQVGLVMLNASGTSMQPDKRACEVKKELLKKSPLGGSPKNSEVNDRIESRETQMGEWSSSSLISQIFNTNKEETKHPGMVANKLPKGHGSEPILDSVRSRNTAINRALMGWLQIHWKKPQSGKKQWDLKERVRVWRKTKAPI